MFNDWLFFLRSVSFIVFFSCTYGPIVWVYVAEIFPLEIKGVASGLAASVHWLSAILTVFVIHLISDRTAYTIFTCMGGIAFVVLYSTVRETKGRHVDESPFIVLPTTTTGKEKEDDKTIG